MEVLCKDGKLVIPKSLQHRTVSWYHHYLQHPGHSCLEKTLRATMYWKSMYTTIQSHVKRCQSCHVNKRWKLKYSKLPPKLIIMTPWEALCVNLVGPYTLKGKDGSQIDFMCLTIIDPASSWFKTVELWHRPLVHVKPVGIMYPKWTHLLILSLTLKPNLPKVSPDSGLDSILGSH